MRVGLVGKLNCCFTVLLKFDVDMLSSTKGLGVPRPLRMEFLLRDTVYLLKPDVVLFKMLV